MTQLLDKTVASALQDTNLADFEFSQQEYLEDTDTTLALTLQANKKGICSIGESQSPSGSLCHSSIDFY